MLIENIERFHLLFLDQLGRKVDKMLYVLKGGCNLRFFLKSVRYSQDMDFDIHVVRKDTLRKTVNQILNSTPFRLILESKGLEIEHISEAKQTETTQRWKIALKSHFSDLILNTKIEFSRRGLDEEVMFEMVDPMILDHYQLRPFFVSHYSSKLAYLQKVWALIMRTETQARDLFDLFHLITMGVRCPLLGEIKTRIPEGIENAIGIGFDTFRSQVLAYLGPEDNQQYDDPAVWESMVTRVIGELEKCN